MAREQHAAVSCDAMRSSGLSVINPIISIHSATSFADSFLINPATNNTCCYSMQMNTIRLL